MPKILVILDGLEDVSYTELNGKTPLAYGAGEGFDHLISHGSTGKFTTTPTGFSPDTMACVLTLLGIQPWDIPKGRSYFEALSHQLPIHPEDLWLRTNFVKVDEEENLVSPCILPPGEIHHKLVEIIRDEGFSWHSLGKGKGLISFPVGKKYLDTITTFPPHENLGKNIGDCYSRGDIVGDGLRELARKILKECRPYTVLPWGESTAASLPSFVELHGKKGSLVAGKDVVQGVGKALKMEVITSPAFTGDIDTNLKGKLMSSIKASKEGQIVVLHINGTDEVSHGGSATEKAKFISLIDREIILPLISHVKGTKGSFLVTSDHGAICATGEHTKTPVSFWLYQSRATGGLEKSCLDGTKAVSLL